MWIIVNFKIDQSVDFVPNIWYNKGSCAWPKKRSNINYYVENCVDPNEKPDDFEYFDARILSKHPIDNIKDARAKASKAQMTSDLSSHTEDDGCKKKSKINTCLFPPNKSHISTFNASELSLPDYNDYILENDNLDFEIFTSSENLESPNVIDVLENKNQSASLHKKMKLSKNESPSYPLNSSEKMPTNIDNKVKDYHKNVNRNIITLKHEIKNIQDRLDIVIDMQEKMFEKLCNLPATTFQGISFDESNDFEIITIDNEDDLNVMEQKLSDVSMKKNMIRQLSRLMGQNMAETVRKVMQKLFTDSFLSKYSFIGFKGKNNFSTLKSCKIIFESIRKMKKFSDSTDFEIEKPLKNWLAQATPRLLSRVKKNNANDTTAIVEQDNMH